MNDSVTVGSIPGVQIKSLRVIPSVMNAWGLIDETPEAKAKYGDLLKKIQANAKRQMEQMQQQQMGPMRPIASSAGYEPLEVERPMIQGVVSKAIRTIPDERGRVIEMLRSDDPLFQKFGQVYVTTVYPGVVKGWHYHKVQTDFVCCVSGMIKLVVCQPKESIPGMNATQVAQYFIGEHNPQLITIPPGVYHGWKGIGEKESVVMCVSSEPYNYESPDEYRVDPHNNEIPYYWGRKDG
jgi:dTDP-4-dehydrorhamnose 3,5-epimerase